MLKILVVSGTFPPRKYGGVTTITYIYAKKMVERGHKVTVFTTDVGNDSHSRLNVQGTKIIDGICVHYFRNVSNVLAFKHRILLSLGMISALGRSISNFDIVHLNGLRSPHDIVAAYYAKKYGIPYVLQAHGSLPRIRPKRILKWVWDELFGRKLLRGASRVIALSRVEAEQYKAMGVTDEKVTIIPNAIDLSEYTNLPPKGFFKKKFGIPEHKKVILYLGRIDKTKGIDLLVKAYASLVKDFEYNDAVLVIAGPDEGYFCEVKSLVRSFGVCDSVLFTGLISAEDKVKALVDAETFVIPSFYGFPITFLEACAAGIPIITTNLGDNLEWIDGNVGYVTPPTPHGLAKAMYTVISDNGLRRRFSENCIRTVRFKFSIEKVVEKLERLYYEVVDMDSQEDFN